MNTMRDSDWSKFSALLIGPKLSLDFFGELDLYNGVQHLGHFDGDVSSVDIYHVS